MVAKADHMRLFGFISMFMVFFSTVLVFHKFQVRLNAARNSTSSCTQQLESFSSQLQVIKEHNLKLEMSLEKEKHEHLKTKEDFNGVIQYVKHMLRDKQNVDSKNRSSEIEQNHEVLQEEEKNVREELEKLKLKYLEGEKKNKQLTQELNDAQNKIQHLNLKSGSVTPAINPQAIDGVTASSKVNSSNQSPVENDEANPINQPIIIDISFDKVPNNALVPQNDTSSTEESQVGGNESMKAMPATPQDEDKKDV